MNRKQILIVEDEVVIRSSLKKFLEKQNYKVCEAGSVDEAAKLDLNKFALIISDLRLPGKSGVEIIRLAPNVPVLVMTSYASLRSAVDTMKLGAVDYIAKPFDYDELLDTVRGIVDEPDELPPLSNMIGRCKPMVDLFARVRKVAPTDSNVLVVGESGTGKELIARAIHHESARNAQQMISLNCAAIPDTLIESELFGHEKGAFTGATNARVGLVEAADQSTLFLDEIGELPLEAQARLLRVLQEGEVRRVGSVETRKVSVRLIAATHRDLRSLVETNNFREDLYYRLNVVKLTLPPLRERGDDIPLISDHILERMSRKLGRSQLHLNDETREFIARYQWPGNIRELENAIQRAVILCETHEITPDLLAVDPEQPPTSSHESSEDDNVSLEDYFQKFVLEHQDHMTETQLAQKLGISRKSLWQKRQKLDIPRKRSRKR